MARGEIPWRQAPHPGYGECDTFAPDGGCSECAKTQFLTRYEWEQWLEAGGARPSNDKRVEAALHAVRAAENALRVHSSHHNIGKARREQLDRLIEAVRDLQEARENSVQNTQQP
jgi:hypothetical protein